MSRDTRLMREVQQFIRDNGITEFCDLAECLMDGGDSMAGMFDVVTRNTLFFDEYLASLRRMSKNQTAKSTY